MKKLIFTITTAFAILTGNVVLSQVDSVYFVKGDSILSAYATTDVDSVIFYRPNGPSETSSVKYGEGVTDIDGNVYQSVIIGNQEWISKNLRTSKYSDGTSIPNVTDGGEWSDLETPAWCHYKNDSSQYEATYGKLYNWYAVETGKLCPTGWHVPTDAEWTVLTDYLAANGYSGSEGTALKSTSGWNDDGNGTDDYGWLGLPGGERFYNGNFGLIGSNGYWWSSSQYDAINAWGRGLYEEYRDLSKLSPGWFAEIGKRAGLSVRCLRYNDTIPVQLPTLTTASVSNIISTSALSGGNITNNGGATIIKRGVVWSTIPNPTILDSMTNEGYGIGSFESEIIGLTPETKYYLRAYATNSSGTDYGNELSFTTTSSPVVVYGGGVTDANGNTYQSVIIGTQEWMSENLRTTKYSDGTSIPNVTDGGEWSDLETGAWSHYENDSSQYEATYGKLYNWYAVETGKLCPTGWHVPTDSEWTVLTDYLAANGYSGSEGTALKSTSGWNDDGNGTDDYGWLGLPGGSRYSPGDFGGIGDYGDWWSSSQYITGYAWIRYFHPSDDSVYRNYFKKENGESVRCLRD